MEIKNGSIKYPANSKTFPSRYSNIPQQSLLVTMDDGTEERFYFDQGRYPHAHFNQGDRVTVVFEYIDNKKSRKLAAADGHSPPRRNTPPTQNLPPQQQQQNYQQSPNNNNVSKTSAHTPISAHEFTDNKAKLFKALFLKYQNLLSDLGLSTEDLRALSISTMIEASRNNVQLDSLIEAQPMHQVPVTPIHNSNPQLPTTSNNGVPWEATDSNHIEPPRQQQNDVIF